MTKKNKTKNADMNHQHLTLKQNWAKKGGWGKK